MAVLKLSWMFRPNLIQSETSYFISYKTDENVIVIESNVVMFPKKFISTSVEAFLLMLGIKTVSCIWSELLFQRYEVIQLQNYMT